MKSTPVFVSLKDGKKLKLIKGPYWEDAYLGAFVFPLLNGEEPSKAERIKSSKYARIWKLKTEQGPLSAKFFCARGFRDKLVVRTTRARRALKGSMSLMKHGFLVPDIIAQGDVIKGINVVENFFITRWLERCPDIEAYMTSQFKPALAGEALQMKRDLIRYMGAMIGEMHKEGIAHGDLRPGNILLKGQAALPDFYFIDNERTKYFAAGIPPYFRRKNLVQLNMIGVSHITAADRLRFMMSYIGKNPEMKRTAKMWIRKVHVKTKKRYAQRLLRDGTKNE